MVNTHCIVLQPKGTNRNAVLSETAIDEGNPSSELAGLILRRVRAPESIGVWSWGETTVHLYGYKVGKADTENKHELPPPHDTLLLFGEVVLFATKNDAAGKSMFVNFAYTDYQKFYNETLGGFDDIGSEDTNTEDDESQIDSEEELEEIESDNESIKSALEEIEEEEAPVCRPIIKQTSVKISKRNAKKMPIWFSIPELGENDHPGYSTRKHIHKLILHRLSYLNSTQITDLEKGIYTHCLNEGKTKKIRCVWENPEFLALYTIIAKRVISNLDNNSYVCNQRLQSRLKEGEFKSYNVASMTFQELFPEKWKEMEEHAMKREAKMLEVDKSMATEMFKCSRCQKRQCTYYEMQTRSADEPMTQFVRCLNCGKQWRQ